jgi:hypothetical protein
MAFVPEGQADRSQARSAWVGALWMIYAPKVATGLSPGLNGEKLIKGGLGRLLPRSGLGFSSAFQP